MPGDASHTTAGRHDLDEPLLGGPRVYTVGELAAKVGVEESVVRDYWRTLGLPVVDATDRAFTDHDAVALAAVFGIAEQEGFDARALTTLIRSTGHTTERLVLWQVEAIVENLTKRDGIDDTSARLLMLDGLPELAPILQMQLVHAWRRQLAAIAGRFAVEFSQADAADRDSEELPLPRAVGFADIVSFTRRTSGMNASELAEFVERFEAGARDVVTAAGGRVVKTIGDAVLYVADDVVTGARVALGLAEPSRELTGVEMPPVRVSLVWGRVLSRFGDVFGPIVNLAARLTDVAEPSTVLCDPATACLLADDPAFALVDWPAVDLPGLGLVSPVQLQWPPSAVADG